MSADLSRQTAMIFSRQSVHSEIKSLFKESGTRHLHFVSVIGLSCQNMSMSPFSFLASDFGICVHVAFLVAIPTYFIFKKRPHG